MSVNKESILDTNKVRAELKLSPVSGICSDVMISNYQEEQQNSGDVGENGQRNVGNLKYKMSSLLFICMKEFNSQSSLPSSCLFGFL